MQFVDDLAPGPAVKIVDVLRNDRKVRHHPFHANEGTMAFVRFNRFDNRPTVRVPFPDERRIFHEGVHAGELFRFDLRPDSIGSAKRRDAAFDGDSRPGKRNDGVCLPELPCKGR